MGLNLQGVQAHSGLAGLLELGSVIPDPLTINSFVIPAQSNSAIYSIPINFKNNEVISITALNIKGMSTSFNNYWYPVASTLSLYNSVNTPLGLGVLFVINSAPNGRLLQFQFINNLNNASLTVPTITISLKVNLYSYPF